MERALYKKVLTSARLETRVLSLQLDVIAENAQTNWRPK